MDVEIYTFKYPMGPWPKDPARKKQGAIVAETLKTGLEAYGLQLLTTVGGMEESEVKKLLEETVADLYDRKKHGYTFQ